MFPVFATKQFLRNCRSFSVFNKLKKNVVFSDDYWDQVITSDSEYNSIAENYFRIGEAHRCVILQPYVKWGPRKLEISPEEQLEEAVALIDTLPHWTVEETVRVPLDSLDRKTLMKSGSMDRLTQQIRSQANVTAVFVNLGNLQTVQNRILQENFGKPILDRYKIVMQILKMHATSKHAKLQVALAELYYLQRRTLTGAIFHTGNPETLKLMFQEREQKLKNAMKLLREQRALLRVNRTKREFPVVAVVGYTNAGKTSVIKALTGEESLKPRNQLFATLDVTMHSGIFPSGLEVLYVDTVGFISDIPTNLIECFVATLEDAVLADIVLHVEDLSSSCFEYKRKHVLKTLKSLGGKTGHESILDKVISIGNKADLIDRTVNKNGLELLAVSSKTSEGLEELRYILEDALLKITTREKMTIRVPNGGDEIRWLYKNATVVEEVADESDGQFIKAKVIITKANLDRFKHYYIGHSRGLK